MLITTSFIDKLKGSIIIISDQLRDKDEEKKDRYKDEEEKDKYKDVQLRDMDVDNTNTVMSESG